MSKRCAGIILMFGLVASSCAVPPPSRRPPRSDWVILSESHVNGLGLTEKDLRQVQVFLGRELVIEGVKRSVEKDIERSHRLYVRQTNYVETIRFRKRIPGRIIKMYEDATFWLFNETMKLQVSFEGRGKPFLEFEPDANGRYKLATDPSGLIYGARKYACVEGCSDNYLWVSVDIVRRWQKRSKVARGWRFE